MEKEIFGLDGSLRRTVPGYITAHTRKVLLRRCARYSDGGACKLKAQLEATRELVELRGYEVFYGNLSLGRLEFHARVMPEDPDQEPPTPPPVWDLDAPLE